MKHALEHIRFVGPQGAQRLAVVISAAGAADPNEGAQS